MINEKNFEPSKLVEGYWVCDGKIYNYAQSYSINDVTIDEIGLNNRARNCLLRAQCFNVSNLLLYTYEQLLSIKNMGEGALLDTKLKVLSFLELEFNTTSEDDGSFEIIKYTSMIEDVPLVSFNFSTRVNNALHRAGYSKISDIIDLSYEEFRTIKNMGVKAAQEVYDAVQEYKYTHSMQADIFDDAKVLVIADKHISHIPELSSMVDTDRNSEIVKVSQLVNMTDDELEKVAVFGVAVEELRTQVQRYISCAKIKHIVQPSPEDNQETIEALVEMVSRVKRELENRGISDVVSDIDLLLRRITSGDPALLRSIRNLNDIFTSPTIVNSINRHLMKCFSKNEIEGFSNEEILAVLPVSIGRDNIDALLQTMVENKMIFEENERYYTYYPSFEMIVNESDSKDAEVVRKRISGLTLDVIGNLMGGLTRERIRQREARYMKTVFSMHQKFLEDKYSYIFCKYALDEELMLKFFRWSAETVYYLNWRYKDHKGLESLEDCLSDETVPISIKTAIEKYFRKSRIFINNEYVAAKRATVEEKLYPIICSEEITVDEFFDRYNSFVTESGYEELIVDDELRRSRINKHMGSTKLLWKVNRRMRYYDIEIINKEEFYQNIDLNQYEDIEISAKKIYDDNFELMIDYDIRDEYELHNLIKKTIDIEKYPQVELSRTPIILIGNADRKKQTEELLFELAPIPQTEFAKEYSIRYGVAENTVLANYLKYVNDYNNNGILDISITPLTDQEICELKSLFADDFYYSDDIKRIFTKKYPDASISKINHYSLRQMGFHVYSGYVVSDRYSNAVEYFDMLLNRNDVVDLKCLPSRIFYIQTFYAKLSSYTSNYDLIEFSPKKYISIKRINSLFGTTKEDLERYCKEVKQFSKGKYFTIASLKSDGFTSELDELGFEPHFYASLLAENKSMFSFKKYGNNKVFKATTNPVVINEFVEWLLYQEESLSMDVYELIELISEKYRLNIDKSMLLYEVIPGTTMYYSKITEKLYADYEIYFDEI